MARRTPLELAIAEQTERQAQYEARQRKSGLTRSCVWVPTDRVDELRRIAAEWRDKHEAEQGGADDGS